MDQSVRGCFLSSLKLRTNIVSRPRQVTHPPHSTVRAQLKQHSLAICTQHSTQGKFSPVKGKSKELSSAFHRSREGGTSIVHKSHLCPPLTLSCLSLFILVLAGYSNKPDPCLTQLRTCSPCQVRELGKLNFQSGSN